MRTMKKIRQRLQAFNEWREREDADLFTLLTLTAAACLMAYGYTYIIIHMLCK